MPTYPLSRIPAFIGIGKADVSGDVLQLCGTEVSGIEGGSDGGTESDFILRKQRQRGRGRERKRGTEGAERKHRET